MRISATPGTARAAVVSIERIRAWACGERTSRMCSSPGGAVSSVKRAAPVTISGPAGAGAALPTADSEEPAGVTLPTPAKASAIER